ncbi:MAG: hypothetical protein ACFFD4_08055 [Candidatus Odinarchaeota archaeon]
MSEKGTIKLALYNPRRGYWSEWGIRGLNFQSSCDGCGNYLPVGDPVLAHGHYDPGDGDALWDALYCFACVNEMQTGHRHTRHQCKYLQDCHQSYLSETDPKKDRYIIADDDEFEEERCPCDNFER